MASLYVETTIVSYLTARDTDDVVSQARKRTTSDWWNLRRGNFDLVISQAVLNESAAGDPEAAGRRMAVLAGIPLLEVTAEVEELARLLHQGTRLPAQAATDSVHIAVAAVHRVSYLMTWNLRHIANAELRSTVDRICRRAGYPPPVICTPDELMGT